MLYSIKNSLKLLEDITQIIIDESKDMKFTNPEACKLFGYFKKELIGVNLLSTLIPKKVAEYYDEYAQDSLFSKPIEFQCIIDNQTIKVKDV